MKNVENVKPKKRDVTAERIIKAAKDSKGLLTTIARKARVSHMTLWRYTRDYPSVKEAIEDSQEILYDLVESKLYKLIEEENITAIIFFLKTRCKHRGYVEKQEIETPKDVTIRVVYEDTLQTRPIREP